jgi:Flp pilus assembly protein TadD
LLALFTTEYAYQVAETGLPAAQRGVDLAPEDADMLDTLGWVQVNLGDPAAAKPLLLDALALAPENPGVLLHLGVAYLQEGRVDTAYTYLDKARMLGGESPAGVQAAQIIGQYFPQP